MARLNKKDFDLKTVRSVALVDGGELRFHLHWRKSGGVGCLLWHPDGFQLGHASGYGYDKAGVALAGALMTVLGPEIAAFDTAGFEYSSNEAGAKFFKGKLYKGKLYGLHEWSDGKRHIDGACGIECVIRIWELLGWSVRRYETAPDRAMVVGTKLEQPAR